MIIDSYPWGNYTLEIGQIEKHGGKIFDFEYPFYDPAHKPEFERKFLLHFRYHEIGQETLQRFKYMLQDTLTINHEKYLHYFNVKNKAETLPWWDNKNNVITFEREHDRKTNSKSDSTSSSENHNSSYSSDDSISNGISKYLDTPQGVVDIMGDNEDQCYLTNATKDHSEDATTSETNSSGDSKSNSNSNSSTDGNTKERFTRKEAGNVGTTTQGTIIEDWLKKAHFNIDLMIMNDCEELFMQVY